MKIEVYTKDNCPYCTDAKKWLDDKDLRYTVHDLSDDIKRQDFYVKTMTKSMPQIYIDGERLGGYQELLDHGIATIQQTRGLLDPSIVYKPFLYPSYVEFAKIHEKLHWVEDEVELGEDVSDWKGDKLTPHEKAFIASILTLFTESDKAVAEIYLNIFIPRFKNNEVRMMLMSFANREATHQRAYELLNATLGFPDKFYTEFLEYKEMSDKLDHMLDMDTSTYKGTALALAKATFNEGVSLFASFAMLLNFTRFGKMKGMGKVVDWSIRDETMHADGIAAVFRQFIEEHPRIVNDEFKKAIYEMARKTVELEDKFIDLAFGLDGVIEGITKEETKEYIRFIMDQRLIALGLKENYGIEENPFDWIDWVVGGARHTSFFEQRVSEYSVGGLTGDWEYGFVGETIDKEFDE